MGVPRCWMHLLGESNLRIKQSAIPGANKGVFALKRGAGPNEVIFRRGDRITPYGGERVTMGMLDDRYRDWTAPYGIAVDQNRDIYENGACMRGVGTMINHAPRNQANARFGRVGDASWVVATRAIRNDQEILVDYGDDYRFDEPTAFSTKQRRA